MKRLFFTLLFLFCLTLAGCAVHQPEAPEIVPKKQDSAAQEAEPKYLPETAPEPEADKTAPEAPDIHEILSGMTLEQKVGQLFFVRCPEQDVEEKIERCCLGGLLLFGRDYKDANGNWLTKEAFTAKLESYQEAAQASTGVPLLIGSDEEGGTVTRASRNPNLFPEKSKSPQELYASGGIGAVLNDTARKNDRLCELGINVNFAPVCDVSTDPKDFIYARSLGKNAAETMAYVIGVVSVMNDEHVGAVLKHFPGYGNNVDTHTGIAVDERPIEWFEKSDLMPFEGGIQAGAPFVLVSHNIVECMDPEHPASLSPAVHELLRQRLGFDGVILTDDLAMEAVKAYAEGGTAATEALLSGNDMIVTTDFEEQIAEVLNAVAEGRIEESVIDAACLRVLTAKLRLGLLGEQA